MLFLNVEYNGKHTIYDGVALEKIDDLKLKETHLHSLGYGLGKSGIGVIARRELLKMVIAKKELTVGEVKQILNQNIRMFSNRDCYKSAVRDWMEDLKYVNEIVVGRGR